MEEVYQTQVKVPKSRVAVVIGTKGVTKAEIEEATGVQLSVNTEEGIVSLRSDDPLKLYNVQQIVKAIARGFNPKKAMLLLKGDFMFEIIDLKEFVKKDHMLRVKGRVIGEEGKCRENIERLTETMISVYGKTVSILGRTENVTLAKRALTNLIQGSPHANVYHWLEKKRVELKVREILPKDFLREEYKDERID